MKDEGLYRPAIDRVAKHIPDPLMRLRYLQAVAPQPRPPRHRLWKCLAISVVCAILMGAAPPRARIMPVMPRLSTPTGAPVPATPAPTVPSAVWTVETGPEFELFSNGLRIETRYAVANRPRTYRAFPLQAHAGRLSGDLRDQPVGIVYHTTESLQAPFDASQNAVLKRVSESLAEFVQRRRSYNFLIDRFGRVYRIVREQDAANHAGHSIWADDNAIYINLNDSFLGISFEAETANLPGAERVNPAQVRAGTMLTELLRYRYHIDGRNCVTHAQVSVNPANFRIGYHTDWASSFPFQRLGLPDNYATPLPAVTLFGFTYDSIFVDRAGDRLAAAAEQSPAPARDTARRRYQGLAKSLHTLSSAVE
jgi:hypothetical protein